MVRCSICKKNLDKTFFKININIESMSSCKKNIKKINHSLIEKDETCCKICLDKILEKLIF